MSFDFFVDFIWINRDQKSFEWFLNLLSMIEADQETDQNYVCENRVCNLHPYIPLVQKSVEIVKFW